jgi:hypothetical protein
MRKKIRSKKSVLLDMLESGKVGLDAAAAALYDCDTELNRLRVVRLLAAYRQVYPDFYYHVRSGEIVNGIPQS